MTVGKNGGSLKSGWGGDRDNDCCYNEFEVLWNIHSDMLSRKLGVLDEKSEEPVRDFSKEMASRSQGNCELARNRVTQDWKLNPGRFLYLGSWRKKRHQRRLKRDRWKVRRKTRGNV